MLRWNNGLGLALPQKFIERKSDVLRYLAEQDWRDIAALMERHSGTPALYVSKLLMRTSLADFSKAELHEDGDDLARLKNRGVTHCLRNSDVLHADKLRF